MKKILLFLLGFSSLYSGFSATGNPAENRHMKVYEAMLKMQVASYRIARDKLYEIYHPDFELIQPDLAQAITIFENNITFLHQVLTDATYQAELDRLTDVWNNMRFHILDVLNKKNYARFYYDSMTMDNLLGVILNKYEDKYGLNDKRHLDLKKQYTFCKSVYLTNIGFLTRKYNMARSLHSLFDQNIDRVERLLRYAIRNKYAQNPRTSEEMARLLNDWKFFRYNTSNVLFSAERTLFATANSIDFHTKHLAQKLLIE